MDHVYSACSSFEIESPCFYRILGHSASFLYKRDAIRKRRLTGVWAARKKRQRGEPLPTSLGVPAVLPPSLGDPSLSHALLLEREFAREAEQLLVQRDGGSVVAACRVHVGRGQRVVDPFF